MPEANDEGTAEGAREHESPAAKLLRAVEGAGPLLQRDYWAVIRACRFTPSQVTELVARRFAEFAPAELCVFERGEDADGALEQGEEVCVHIQGAGPCHVRVIHRDAQSLTLATLPGHPEAGRITFGAYRNVEGDVVFHIRSRARSNTLFHRWGFVAAGEPMQTNTWTEFVLRVALTTGEGAIGHIRADTTEVDDEDEKEAETSPTFVARGD
jgi:hypothetical protein